MHSLAVNADLDFLVCNKGTVTKALDRKLVFAVGRKSMTNEHSPASAKSQTFNLVILRGIARGDIGRYGRRLPITNRYARDLPRRHAGLQHGLGQRQRTGDVVKTLLDCPVAKCRGIYIDIQQS